jgi:hypothetical protein
MIWCHDIDLKFYESPLTGSEVTRDKEMNDDATSLSFHIKTRKRNTLTHLRIYKQGKTAKAEQFYPEHGSQLWISLNFSCHFHTQGKSMFYYSNIYRTHS